MTKKNMINNNSATHHVIINFEGGDKEVFDAVIDVSDEDTRLYKLLDCEVIDDTFVEIRKDIISVVVDDLKTEVDLLDFSIDGASFHLSCEYYDCVSVEIDAECICEEKVEIAKILAKTPPFGKDEDDWYSMLVEE